MAKAGRMQQATQRRSGGGFLLGMFVGLLIGLGIALGVAFYLNRTPIPFLMKSRPAAKDGVAEGASAAKPPAIAGMAQGGRPLPAAGTEAAQDKPKYDFYRILPGGEETVSDKELKDGLRAAQSQAEPAGDVYYVQAGAFQNPADADNQKANLAILGLESSVEPTHLPDKGTWYRVRLGPFTRIDEINRVRQTLAQNGIDASLVKLRRPAAPPAAPAPAPAAAAQKTN